MGQRQGRAAVAAGPGQMVAAGAGRAAGGDPDDTKKTWRKKREGYLQQCGIRVGYFARLR